MRPKAEALGYLEATAKYRGPFAALRMTRVGVVRRSTVERCSIPHPFPKAGKGRAPGAVARLEGGDAFFYYQVVYGYV